MYNVNQKTEEKNFMINNRSRYFKLSIIGISILLAIVQTGCWDYNEIERRGYVLGIAIDVAEPHPRGQDDLEEYMNEREIEKMIPQKGSPRYSYTIQIPIVSQARNRPEAGGGPVDEARTWNLTIAGNSFFEVNRQFATRLDFAAFYEHLQVVVISEEVARQGILEPMDFLLRDHELRRRTRVFITPGEAKAILDVIPRIEDYSSMYLAKLPLGASKTSRIADLTDLGVVSQNIHHEVDFTLPRVTATKDEIKDAGVAIFKGDKMTGWLGEIDTIWAKWIRDLVKGGVVVVESPNEKGKLVTVEIVNVSSKVRPHIQNDEIFMNIDIKGQFNLVEEMRYGKEDVFEVDFIRSVEKLIEEKIATEIKDTVAYVQEEFEADIFRFDVAMMRYAPREWEMYEQHWADIFPLVKLNVNVDATIRLVGLTR